MDFLPQMWVCSRNQQLAATALWNDLKEIEVLP